MNKGYYSQLDILWTVFSKQPNATAHVMGSENYPEIKGVVQFYQHQKGVLVVVEMMGLPTEEEACKSRAYAFHLHEGEMCAGNVKDPFANVGMHYNPNQCQHPYHAGDFPPLLENEGYAIMIFLTNRFRVEDVLGKTVIVHSNTDDFHTQPSGNAGEKIACGEIIPIRMDRG